MAYTGRYSVHNTSKYRGDASNVVFRSLWERNVFRWCDANDDVVEWLSEEIVIPYICKTDNRAHRYFVDLMIKFKNGSTLLVEIKPKNETVPPKVPQRVTRLHVSKVFTYAKNVSKWEAADKYAKDRGWTFEIWTEETLKKLGIRILTNK